jgi:hypothetical protein
MNKDISLQTWRRQAQFLGNVLQKKKLEDIVITGKICGKTRQRKTTRNDTGQIDFMDEEKD